MQPFIAFAGIPPDVHDMVRAFCILPRSIHFLTEDVNLPRSKCSVESVVGTTRWPSDLRATFRLSTKLKAIQDIDPNITLRNNEAETSSGQCSTKVLPTLWARSISFESRLYDRLSDRASND